MGALVTLKDFKTRAYVKGENEEQPARPATYCGVGCQLYLHVRNDRVVEVDRGGRRGSELRKPLREGEVRV